MVTGQQVYVRSMGEFGTVRGSWGDTISVELDSGGTDFFSTSQVELVLKHETIGNPVWAW